MAMMSTCNDLAKSINRYGLAEVSAPSDDVQVDIVFVHGLNGHPYDTWTSEENKIFWPAQLLPPRVKNEKARVLVYGYDADVAPTASGVSSDKIHNHAEHLVATLCASRHGRKALERPIIFVAHSLGGIVVKRALIYSAGKRGTKTGHLRSIFVSTYGIMFLATPHYGSDPTRWNSWLENICSALLLNGPTNTPQQLVDALKPNSETLQNIDRQFIEITDQFQIYYFHETKKTKLGRVWRYIVEEDSAAPVIQDVERAGIPQDHIHISQFDSDRSPGFDLVMEGIQRYAIEAPETIRLHWEQERRERLSQRDAMVKMLLGGPTSGLARVSPNDPGGLATEKKVFDDVSSRRADIPSEAHQKRYYIVPRERVKDFIGREAQLAGISSLFSRAPTQLPQVLILHALGGQGKSQIVLEYCQRSRRKYRGIFWVNASSETLAIQSYVQIAKALLGDSSAHVENDDRVIEVVKDCLESSRAPWLLVFDNYDQPNKFDKVERFLPKSMQYAVSSLCRVCLSMGLILLLGEQCHVIFTTRNQDLDRLGSLMEIPAMDSNEGVDLLLREHSCHDINDNFETAVEIVRRLGGLALAIDQAAAYIRYMRIPPDRLGEFLTTYDHRREKTMSYTPPNFWKYGTMQIHGKEDQNKAISAFTTWEMSLEQLKDAAPLEKNEMTHFLTLSAYFNPARIEESLFSTYWNKYGCWRKDTAREKDTDQKEDTDRKKETDGKVEWLRVIGTASDRHDARVSCGDTCEEWDSDRFWDMLSKLREMSLSQSTGRNTQGASFSIHPLIRDWLQLRLEPEIRRRFVEESLTIAATNARYYYENDFSINRAQHDALLAHVDACIMNDRTFSEPQLQIGNDVASNHKASWIADLYNLHGRYESMEALRRKIYKSLKASLGSEHTDTLQQATHWSRALLRIGKYNEAEETARRTFHSQKATLGEKDLLTLESMGVLASTLIYLGRPEESELLYRHEVELRLEVSERSHPKTLWSMSGLAWTLYHRSKLSEAEKVVRESLRLREMILGMNHPNSSSDTSLLALILNNQGKVEEAEKLQRQVWHSYQEALGKDHPYTLVVMFYLANIVAKKESHEAEMLYREVLQLGMRLRSKENPYTLSCMQGLMRVLWDQGKINEAEEVKRQMLQSQVKVLGVQYPDTLESMLDLAKILFRQGKIDEAVNMAPHAVQLMQETRHRNLLPGMESLLAMLQKHGNHGEAKQIQRQISEIEQAKEHN
ncbi:MAG: hypothetical protein Q9181_007073 [Wetmoreana brouardii]